MIKNHVSGYVRHSPKGKVHKVKGFDRKARPPKHQGVHKGYTREVDYFIDSNGRIAYRKFRVPNNKKAMMLKQALFE